MVAALNTLLAWSIDPVKWARECCDWEPDPWQGEALRARGCKSPIGQKYDHSGALRPYGPVQT